MAFNGSEGGTIDIDDAGDLTETFRTNYSTKAKCFFLGKEHIMDLLDQEGAQGIRIYLGEEPKDGDIVPIWVAADSSENDLIELVKNYSKKGPPHSSNNNTLNS